MNNLRKFTTEAEYSAATLNYPAVSWIVSGDTLHYDLSGGTPTPSAPAIKVAFTMDECGNGKSVVVIDDACQCEAITALTVNGVDFDISSSTVTAETSANTDYLIEYFLKDSTTYACYNFGNISTPWGCASATIYYDILYPAQITSIGGVGTNINNMIVLSETPPTISSLSDCSLEGNIYVPDSVVNTYKNDSSWGNASSVIYPLSQYSGNIPLS